MNNLNLSRNQVQDLLYKGGIYPDQFKRSKTGEYTVRRSYFYRHGQSPELIAEGIVKAIPEAQIVRTSDDYAHWPKTSYFTVVFRIN